jgi:hypothetical protein
MWYSLKKASQTNKNSAKNWSGKNIVPRGWTNINDALLQGLENLQAYKSD